MKKELSLPTVALFIGSFAVLWDGGVNVLLEAVDGVPEAPSLEDMTATDTGPIDSAVVLPPATIIEPQPPKRMSEVTYFVARNLGDSSSDPGDT